MARNFKDKLIELINTQGVYDSSKMLGISITDIVRLSGIPIYSEIAYEVLYENINNKNLPTKYKEFKINAEFDGVVGWDGNLKTGYFSPDITETVHALATPFYDGNNRIPIDLDWYTLSVENNKIISNISGDGDYFNSIDHDGSFNNIDELFDWYKKVYLPMVYRIIMNKILPSVQQAAYDDMGHSQIEEQK